MLKGLKMVPAIFTHFTPRRGGKKSAHHVGLSSSFGFESPHSGPAEMHPGQNGRIKRWHKNIHVFLP